MNGFRHSRLTAYRLPDKLYIISRTAHRLPFAFYGSLLSLYRNEKGESRNLVAKN
jgi:hypothetical protein